ncbi:MAG: hypothetical protein JRG88_05655 [Deltaproteobacteria bacterium]|nr:hypothetical protein [Deltaproteobacteria bacterium]
MSLFIVWKITSINIFGMKNIINILTTICLILFSLSGNGSIALSNETLKQFSISKRKTFSTKRFPKAKGLHMTIDYPYTWTTKLGRRPNVVQVLQGKSNKGNLSQCIIIVKRFQRQGGEKIEFTPEVLQSISGGMGAKYLNGGKTIIDNEPAGWLLTKQDVNQAGINITMYALHYMILYNKYFISIQLSVGDLSENEKLKEDFFSMVPLFIQMGNSIIFPEKYKQ